MNNENLDLKAALKRIQELESELEETKNYLNQNDKVITNTTSTLKNSSIEIDLHFGVLKNTPVEKILDIDAIQSIMDIFNKFYTIGMAIVDLEGKVLVASGWQDICTQYHRIHPATCKYCNESDTLLSDGVDPGKYKLQYSVKKSYK